MPTTILDKLILKGLPEETTAKPVLVMNPVTKRVSWQNSPFPRIAALEAKVDTENNFKFIPNPDYSLNNDTRVITMRAGWIGTINGVDYTNLSSVVLPAIPLTTTNYSRIDLIVFTTDGTFIKIQGQEKLSSPVKPAQPINTLEATFIVVNSTQVQVQPIPKPKLVPTTNLVQEVTLLDLGIVTTDYTKDEIETAVTTYRNTLPNVVNGNKAIYDILVVTEIRNWNTFIGGVSSTLYSAALLAVKLYISIDRVKNFVIDGTDIKCRIIGNYAIRYDCFYHISGNVCTFYRDTDNLITAINDQAFYAQQLVSSVFYNINFKNCLRVEYRSFARACIREIILENLTYCGSYSFSGNENNLQKLYIPRCTDLGGSALNNNVFQSRSGWPFSTGLKIYAHPSLATNNAGAPDGDLTYAISIGATVRYVTNFDAPNLVTTLAAGTIAATTVQLNFTLPTGSTNAIDYYECWANGVQKNNITASGQNITGLTAGTAYNIKLIAVDIFYNKSVVSNAINVNTL
jgi:hypothetical protein